MLNKLVITDVNVKGKKVLVRVDYNLPLDEKGEIIDDTRIQVSLPTIKHIINSGGKAILLSHMGRPDGTIQESMRLTKASNRLSELLNKEVRKTSDCVGDEVKGAVAEMAEGEVILLENLRFHSEEEENDLFFAKELASLGDVYVDDAFSTIHRDHASITGITRYIKEKCAGICLAKEIEYMSKIMERPDRPLIALLGGAKVSTKIEVIKSLLSKVDGLLIGGGMVFTFYSALGFSCGKSKIEEDFVAIAKDILLSSIAEEKPIYLPQDIVVAPFISEGASSTIVGKRDIPADQRGVDIGPATVKRWTEIMDNAACVFWNGPVGIFEIEKFSQGTRQIAGFLAGSPSISTIIGGGDTAAAVTKLGLADKMTHISTGGGASLEYIAGKEMPGLAVLPDKR